MRFQVAFALIATAFACLVASSTGQGDEGKCARAFPLPPWRSSYRTKCTYLCQDWPFRYENEPDGIPCGALAAFIKTHVCRDGKCVKAENVQTTAADEEYFRTGPSTSTEAPQDTEAPQETEAPRETEAPYITDKVTVIPRDTTTSEPTEDLRLPEWSTAESGDLQ